MLNKDNYQNHFIDVSKTDVHTGIKSTERESVYVENAKLDGCKNGIWMRRHPAIWINGATITRIVPQFASPTSTSSFGQGLFFEDCGTTYVQDVYVDGELGLKNNQNTDCLSDNGQGNSDDLYMGEFLYVKNCDFYNPGETVFDCKRIAFAIEDTYLGGVCEEVVKHWRASTGYFSNVIFDMSKMSTPVSFRMRGNSAGAKLYFYNCTFKMPDGSFHTMPPESTVKFDSGYGGSYEKSFFKVNERPEPFLNPFFEKEIVEEDPGPVVDYPKEIAALEARVKSLEDRLGNATISLNI